jgi:hypothetical protein
VASKTEGKSVVLFILTAVNCVPQLAMVVGIEMPGGNLLSSLHSIFSLKCLEQAIAVVYDSRTFIPQ